MLGRVLTKHLSAKHEVAAVSKSGRNNTVVCDLSQAEALEKFFGQHSFDLVIHTAAYSDVDGCERDPKLAHESNALATKYLAQNCTKFKISFIHVSTDYVFDGRKKSPYKEEDTVCPVNIYGLTKLEGEYYARTLPPVSAIVRTSWLFGPDNPANFVNAVTERLKHEKVVRVLDDQEDSPTYVADLAAVLEKIGDALFSLVNKNRDSLYQETFHVCNAGSTTRYGLTLKIKEILGLKDVSVERFDKKDLAGRLAIRPAYAVMSTERFEKTFQMKMRPWEESLKEYLCGS